MEQIVLFSIAPGDLRTLIANAVAEAFNNQPQPEIPPPPISGIDTLNRREVLRALQCTSPTLMALERNGELAPCKRMGRKPLWLRRDVERFLNGRQQ